jgi:hypothetical protein
VFINLSLTTAAPSDPATFAIFQGSTYAWSYSGSQSNCAHISLQIPHSYKPGTDLRPHLHWTKTTATANDVIWGLEYSIASRGSNFVSTTTTIYMTNACTVAGQHRADSFPSIPGTGLTESCVMLGKLFRLGNVDADSGAAFALSFDVHFQKDKLGSDNELP